MVLGAPAADVTRIGLSPIQKGVTWRKRDDRVCQLPLTERKIASQAPADERE